MTGVRLDDCSIGNILAQFIQPIVLTKKAEVAEDEFRFAYERLEDHLVFHAVNLMKSNLQLDFTLQEVNREDMSFASVLSLMERMFKLESGAIYKVLDDNWKRAHPPLMV